MTNNIYNIFKTLDEKHILLTFKGMITSELLTTILSMMESKMDSIDEKPKVKKKVFNVLVECLQNLYHHIDDHEDPTEGEPTNSSALLMIAKLPDQYQIMTGNYMNANEVNDLKTKLDHVNSLNKDELKLYYKEVLSNGQRSKKGTAGLGMIDIARKSGQKLDYEFFDINSDTSFYSLTVKIAE